MVSKFAMDLGDNWPVYTSHPDLEDNATVLNADNDVLVYRSQWKTTTSQPVRGSGRTSKVVDRDSLRVASSECCRMSISWNCSANYPQNLSDANSTLTGTKGFVWLKSVLFHRHCFKKLPGDGKASRKRRNLGYRANQ